MTDGERVGHRVVLEKVPPLYPTNYHTPAFWEALGRAVATFGFLEETLGKAIFTLTGTRRIPEDQIDAELSRWWQTLERALHDTLGSLIEMYERAARAHASFSVQNFENLIADLREASSLRNVLCHGSWRWPDSDGRSVPFFVNRRNMIFDTPIDCAFLEKTQKATTEMACAVINSVTSMGWQFPGSNGPGRPVW